MEWYFRLGSGFIGVLAAVLYNLNSPSARGRIEKLFPGRGQKFYDWVDFVLLLIFGTIISFVGYQPQEPIRGIFGGASAVAVLRHFVLRADPVLLPKQKRRRNESNP